MNSFSDMWNELCFLLSENVSQSCSERDFENQVVRSLEVLGWREFKGEIVRQPTFQLGREGTLRPDLVIYDQENLPLIVLEVKRPIEDITKDNTIGQLRSYMRQMKSEFGFLVGSEIRLYYDGASNSQPDPLLLEKIPFKRNLPEGEIFARNFNKNSFLKREYSHYLDDKIKKFSRQRQITKLSEILLSEETNQRIVDILRKEFVDYGDEIFSEALKKLTVEVKKREETILAQKPKDEKHQKEKTIPSIKNNKELRTIGTSSDSSDIGRIAFESRLVTRLRQIYGVLYFMRKGFDFPSATNQALRLFPEVKDYQTISNKCTRCFAGNVDTFVAWYHSGNILRELQQRFDLSRHDYGIFEKLLSP